MEYNLTGPRFNTATDAFEYLYDFILENGKDKCGTRFIKNITFIINNPTSKNIETQWRKFNNSYAEYEWEWYKTGNPNAEEISKTAKIWANCMDDNGNVQSNYGYQWNRGQNISQLDYICNELTENPLSRRAVISIYDGKESHLYKKDTPCTLSITFSIDDNKLDIAVHMRSNDLVYGFCNDQYCFAKLQEMVAQRLNIEIGTYCHSVVDMHIYERHFDMKIKNTIK
jgi:thymidylate synthase